MGNRTSDHDSVHAQENALPPMLIFEPRCIDARIDIKAVCVKPNLLNTLEYIGAAPRHAVNLHPGREVPQHGTELPPQPPLLDRPRSQGKVNKPLLNRAQRPVAFVRQRHLRLG